MSRLAVQNFLDMEKLFVIIYYVLLLPYFTIYGDSFSTVVPLNTEQNSIVKSALRYGFQKTSECLNFEKSFLCIQKCLDLNFDVAYADKNCKCTCHIKKEKAEYTIKYNFTRTKWKLGAPTTSIPPWAQNKKIIEETEPSNIIELTETEAGHVTVTIEPNSTKAEQNFTTVDTVTSTSIEKSNVTDSTNITKGSTDVVGTVNGPLATTVMDHKLHFEIQKELSELAEKEASVATLAQAYTDVATVNVNINEPDPQRNEAS